MTSGQFHFKILAIILVLSFVKMNFWGILKISILYSDSKYFKTNKNVKKCQNHPRRTDRAKIEMIMKLCENDMIKNLILLNFM